MGRVVGWHVRFGDTALRWLLLHLLWIAGTLAGGVVLGILPATAAVLAVLRRDLRDPDGARERLDREFSAAYRAEFRAANRAGWPLLLVAGFLAWDRHLLGLTAGGPVASVAAGLLWALGVATFVVGSLVLPLQAHFAEGALGLFRRAVVLVLARPLVGLGHAAVVGVVLGLYYEVPGLVPVFGVVLPAWVSFAWLWRSGVLGAPAGVGVTA